MSDMIYLTTGQQIKPNVDEKSAKKLFERLYGLRVKQIGQLNAYDDKNYHVICERDFENPHIQRMENDGYILKIINSFDSQKTNVIEAQTDMLLFLNQRGIECPVPVKQKNGSYFSLEVLETESLDEKGDTGKTHAVRLLVFKPGVLLSKVPVTEELMIKVGRLTVKLDQVLAGFSHPAYENHSSVWSLKAVPKLRDFVYAIDSQSDRHLVNSVFDNFEENVIGIIDKLGESMIHGDLNDQNIIVNPNGEDITAVIDFGDSHRGCLIFELAIAMCYMIILAKDIGVGQFILKGYQEERILTEVERKLLKLCICARLCQTLTMGVYSYKLDPQNEYLLITQKSGWDILRKLWPMSDDEVYRIWKL